MLGTMTHMQQRRPATIQSQYTCKYCHFVFVREQRYLDHECKQMKREKEFKSPAGQAAWNYYSLWLRHNKRMPPTAESFLSSKYFRTFVNFNEFVKKVDLPKPDRFIWYMVQKKFGPTMWQNNDVYVMYLEFIDREMTPLDHAQLSIDTLFTIANAKNVDISDIFTVVKGNDIIRLLQVRKLSPWLLLHSSKFKQFYMNDVSTEQKMILDQLIRPEFWVNKKEQYAAEVIDIKRLTTAMGI